MVTNFKHGITAAINPLIHPFVKILSASLLKAPNQIHRFDQSIFMTLEKQGQSLAEQGFPDKGFQIMQSHCPAWIKMGIEQVDGFLINMSHDRSTVADIFTEVRFRVFQQLIAEFVLPLRLAGIEGIKISGERFVQPCMRPTSRGDNIAKPHMSGFVSN